MNTARTMTAPKFSKRALSKHVPKSNEMTMESIADEQAQRVAGLTPFTRQGLNYAAQWLGHELIKITRTGGLLYNDRPITIQRLMELARAKEDEVFPPKLSDPKWEQAFNPTKKAAI